MDYSFEVMVFVFKSSLNTDRGKSTSAIGLLGSLNFSEIQVSWEYGILDYGRGTILVIYLSYALTGYLQIQYVNE